MRVRELCVCVCVCACACVCMLEAGMKADGRQNLHFLAGRILVLFFSKKLKKAS